jgi:Zn-dependent M28 family amino/carboxypeptidase
MEYKVMVEILKAILLVFMLGFVVAVSLFFYMTWMPRPTLLLDENKIVTELSDLEARLRKHVNHLSASKVGRNYIREDHLTPAKNYISKQFQELGYSVYYNSYELYGDKYSNVIVDIPSSNKKSPVLIVGAHYDSVENSPGANDNASGVAALIELGRYFTTTSPKNYQLRLVAFVNEEPPYFQTEEMGSLVYAKSLSSRDESILGMISIESIGYYSNRSGSQMYPKLLNLFYPDTGNFLSFIGNLQSRKLVTSSISLFRQHSTVPSEGISSPAFIPGVSWSDHWSFWVSGYDAIMVTDTAPYRYEHYHETTDTPDKLHYEQYAKVVYGLCKVVDGLLDKGLN